MNEQALTEKRQAMRRKQTLLGALIYISALIPLYFVNELGLFRLSTEGKWLLVVASIFSSLSFYVLIRLNLNPYLRDPGMTFLQVLTAGIWSLIVAWSVHQDARLLSVVWLLLAFLFGVYTLRTREYLLLSALILVGYFTLVVGEYRENPEGRRYQIEFLYWVILATGLFWMSLVGGYVSMLRRRLKQRKEELSKLAFIDPLTHIHNRRHGMETLEKEIARMERGNSPHSQLHWLISIDSKASMTISGISLATRAFVMLPGS